LSNLVSSEIVLEPSDNKRLSSLCGPLDDNIKQIESRLGVEITYRNNEFKVMGQSQQASGTSSNSRSKMFGTSRSWSIW
jgi:phosphate starvation-inducible PhoH-like protein